MKLSFLFSFSHSFPSYCALPRSGYIYLPTSAIFRQAVFLTNIFTIKKPPIGQEERKCHSSNSTTIEKSDERSDGHISAKPSSVADEAEASSSLTSPRKPDNELEEQSETVVEDTPTEDDSSVDDGVDKVLCGKCSETFHLSDMAQFIQHKV